MIITLSNGDEIEVRRLRVFELDDNIQPPDMSPYLYSEVIGQNTVIRPFDHKAFDIPPIEPTPEQKAAAPGEPGWFIYMDHALYWGAVYHEEDKRRELESYLGEVQGYILANCIPDNARELIVTPEDYLMVYYAAMAPQIELSDLNESLQRTFRATFDGEEVLKKIISEQNGDEDGAKYNAIRAWEIQVMNQSMMTEDEWGALSIKERARRIVAYKIDEWLAHLELEKSRNKKKGIHV